MCVEGPCVQGLATEGGEPNLFARHLLEALLTIGNLKARFPISVQRCYHVLSQLVGFVLVRLALSAWASCGSPDIWTGAFPNLARDPPRGLWLASHLLSH